MISRRPTLKWLLTAVWFGLLLQAPSLFACAACYGQSDSPLAKGMNWGIFALLAVVTFVLSSIASFFVFIGKRSSTLAADKTAPAPADPTQNT
jgi:hypothetical protein